MSKKKQQIAPMNPREKLTNKARLAIHKYAEIAGEKNGRIGWFMVEAVIKAERMRREQLYKWLEESGYEWSSPVWIKK